MKRPGICRPTHQRSRAEQRRECDQRRGSSAERGYGPQWQKARKAFLAEHPLCVMCGREGRIEAATVVDHKVPHRGDQALFWDVMNWQSLCGFHHNRAKQSEEWQAANNTPGYQNLKR